MNRGEIVAAAKSYLNRPNLPDADLNMMIATVEGELNRILREHPRSIRRTSFTQAANNAILPLPVDMMAVIQLRLGTTTYNQYGYDQRELAQSDGNAYIMRGDCAELFPTPGEDSLFYLDYHGAIRALAGNTDTNWVSVYYPDLYLYGVLKEAAVYLKDDQRLANWQNEFTRRSDSVVGQGWAQEVSTTPRIRLG